MRAQEMATLAVEGIVAPRNSARRIIDAQLEMRDVVLLALFAYLVTAILSILIPPFDGSGARGFAHFFSFGAWLANMFVLALIAWLPPRLFGGEARWDEAFRAIVWMGVVTCLLQPISLLGQSLAPFSKIAAAMIGGDQTEIEVAISLVPKSTMFMAITAIVIASCAWIYIYACFIAEIQRMRTWTVLGAMIGAFLMLQLIVMI